MASLDSLKVRKLLKKGIVQSVGTDTPVAIRIRHIGTTAVTSVTVTTATNIVLIDADGTTTSTFATDTTLNAVASRINAAANWECKILDALGAQASASTLLDGAITSGTDANGNVVWDVKQDTSTALELGTCISPHRDFDVTRGERIVSLLEIQYSVNMGTAAVDSVQVYKRKLPAGTGAPLGGGTETKLIGILSVDTTATTVNWAVAGGGRITVGPDEELFIRVKDAATLADATGNYVTVVGEIL